MGNPYIKPTLTGYNANPPTDDAVQEPQNQLEWGKHTEKLGDPLKDHTVGDANATESALAQRLLNGTITTAVNYTVQTGDRGKVVEGTANGIEISLPDATSPQVTDGWELAAYANVSGGSITVETSGSQTINDQPNLTLNHLDFALLTSWGGNWKALIGSQAVPQPQNLVGRAYAQTTALKTITTIIPMDDTIPQITEGDEILSLSYQAADAANILRFTITAMMDWETSQRATLALFKGSGPGAIAAVPQSAETTGRPEGGTMVYEQAAGDTDNNSYTVRVGPYSSGTIWVNGITPGTRLFGGVCISAIVIEELLP